MIVLVILVLVLAVLVAALVYRLMGLRQGGTAAIVRDVPALGGQGWRHGVIRYQEDELIFFRLSSIRIGPDRRLTRQGLEVISRRRPFGDEFDIMGEEIVILELSDDGRRYETALDKGALMAFLSWMESRPSGRSKRRRS
ncbi:MAG: DUF2550 domain-containing protein [Mycobacteriaceae bacterium]